MIDEMLPRPGQVWEHCGEAMGSAPGGATPHKGGRYQVIEVGQLANTGSEDDFVVIYRGITGKPAAGHLPVRVRTLYGIDGWFEPTTEGGDRFRLAEDA